MKIFVIGFNKTGTTSLHHLFENCGINSIHSTMNVMDIIDKYDAFADGIHYNFEEYYNKYPNSLFILNTRPIYKWLISRYKHAEETDFNPCWCWPISDEKTNQWISEREHHFKKILDFFVNKSKQLLIVNIEKPGWENIVLSFIEKKNKDPIAKVNVRPDNKIKYIDDINTNVSKILKERGYNGDEILIKDLDMTLYNYMSFL
jgi:hypothetical protein